MLSLLKRHPFAVEAFFEKSVVLTFAVPKEQLQTLLPECLEPDTFNERWAFIAMALVQTKGLRPKGFPEVVGNDFFLIGYRIFVRYQTNAGKRYRGLFILKSETDKKRMAVLGNFFTHYNYTKTDITQTIFGNQLEIKSDKSDLKIVLEESDMKEVALPETSPFTDWKEARKFAGPLPFTFSYNKKSNEVLIIEGVRENWIPSPVIVKECTISFLDALNIDYRLANAFIIKNIPYYWKKGRVELWKQ